MVSHETRSPSSMRSGAAEHGSQQHNKLYRSSLLLEVAANTASGADFAAHPLIRQRCNKSANQKAAFILHEEPPTNVATLPKLRQLHGRSAAQASKIAYVPASSDSAAAGSGCWGFNFVYSRVTLPRVQQVSASPRQPGPGGGDYQVSLAGGRGPGPGGR